MSKLDELKEEHRRQGHLAAYQLRVLADELDRLNKDWDEEVNKYFNEQKN